MTSKVDYFMLMLVFCVLLLVQTSTSNPIENEKIEELTDRLDRLQAKVDSLEAENEKRQVENTGLKSDVKELKIIVSEQDQEILLLKGRISNVQLFRPYKWAFDSASYKPSSKNYGVIKPKASIPPSSCKDLEKFGSLNLDGLYLVKDILTNKIQAVFCQFLAPDNILQDLIGNIDVKTRNVHFYVQRNTSIATTNAVISFELERINESNAMNLQSGIFTVPVPGIYHFHFSGIKSDSSTFLSIYLQVNGTNVAKAYTSQTATGSKDVLSLSASLRLAANDRVNLYKGGIAVLFDDMDHSTHFSGWLVEETLI